MNERLIQNLHISINYELKAGTKGSFYKIAGKSEILPERLNWGIFAQKKVSIKDNFKLNEINAKYKRNEPGAYKGLNNGTIHTSIWKTLPEYPEFYGYGIVDERFKIFDLLIIYSENGCSSSFEIHLFKGMGKPEYLIEAFSYLRNCKRKKPHF